MQARKVQMTKMARARDTFQFRQEAVPLVEGGQSIAAPAHTLGVVDQTLCNRVKAQRQGKLSGADSKAVSVQHMEISRLRAELPRVKMECDILEKARSYFAKAQPGKVWAGDMTCIATEEGWLFLAVAIDLFSRPTVGWSLRQDMTRQILIEAVPMACFQRHPDGLAELIFHSDRGSPYASDGFRGVLNEYGITSSMSGKGN
jgi:transposase InsO family protein